MGNFGVTPTWVYPLEETYGVVITETESSKKSYAVSSSTPYMEFRLVFNGISDVVFATVLSHYRGVSGTFAAFNWTTVPAYIDAGAGLGADIEGHWVGKPKWTPKTKSWDLEMVFSRYGIPDEFILQEDDDLLLQENDDRITQ